MSKKLYFLISFVLVLSLASAGYGAAISSDALVRIDFDDSEDPNVYNSAFPDTDTNSVEPGYVSMVLFPDVCNLGSLGPGDIVNGIQIDFYGDNIDDRRRGGPNDVGAPPFPEFQINEEGIHRDFIYSASPKVPLELDLWGLGAGQKCDIHIWCFDDGSKSLRVANWKANGDFLLQTSFTGGDESKWPRDNNPGYEHYDFNGIAIADEYGHIYLTNERDPNGDKTHPNMYINALEIYPSVATPNAVNAPHRYKPFDGSEDVPIDTTFSWRPGETVSPNFDVYLSTDPCNLTFLATVGSNSIDPYGASGYLAMGKTYYLGVDANVGGTTYSGPVQTLTTLNNWRVDSFDSYGVGDDLRDVWSDYYVNGTAAIIELVKSSEGAPAVTGNAMDYHFDNTEYPYYAEAWAILNDADLEKPSDKNFITTNVQSLSIWFYGQVLNHHGQPNPVNEKMYAKLIDDNGKSAKVPYSGDMNDITVEEWQEWNIATQEFIDANNAIDLTEVNRIVIGFDAASTHTDGRVYFDDVRLYTTRCVLTERSAGLARADFNPASNEDCIVDIGEVEVIGRDWLQEDLKTDTCEVSPTDPNLVLYLPFDDFNDANSIPAGQLVFYEDDLEPADINGIRCTRNMAPAPHPNCIWCELSQLDADQGEAAIDIVGPGMIFYDINGNPKKTDGNSIYCDQDYGATGERVHCGRWNPVGNWGVGGWDTIGGVRQYVEGDANSDGVFANTGQMTTSVWIKWDGPHTLRTKCQGMIGRRQGWSDETVQFMFECDTVDAPRGSFSLRQYHGPYCIYTAAGLLDQFIGQWIHVSAVADITSEDTEDANEAILYLNGVSVQEGPFYFGGPANPNTITLTVANNAEFQHQDVENFLGEMDEVRIYSRALEPNEIAYLADITPDDGVLAVPVPSPAEIYLQEPEGSRIINFNDFAIMANQWLKKEYWP